MGYPLQYSWASLVVAGDLGLIRELGRSPGEGKGYPLQYYGLENYRPFGLEGRKEVEATFTFHYK